MKTTQGAISRYSNIILFCLAVWFGHSQLFAFSIGQTIQANATVNVRLTAAGTVVGTHSSGAIGTIIGGPTVASLSGTSYTWWNINFVSGVDGWVADIGLSPAPPTVQTLAASLVTSSSAQLNGTVNPNGATASAYFQYGTTTSYGGTTVTGNYGSGTTTVNVPSLLSGLAPNTIFHYRFVASNSGGTSYGSDQTFQTQAGPTVALNSPNGGATWQVGTSQTVGWSVSGDTSQISYFVVKLSLNSGSSYTDISANLSTSTRSFTYTPTSGQVTSSAVIWVRAFNSADAAVAAATSSGTFTIIDASTPALSITTTVFNPATATVGTGYAAQQAMTATGGQTPYSWSASGLPNGMAINSSSGAPFGTPTVSGTFNVTITVKDSSSPQKTVSKVLSLVVTPTVQPDLIIQNVTFSPSSVTAGNFFTVNFRVRNNGTAASVSTLARLRITADTTLTSADPPLSPLDVSIPAISAGNYHDFSGTFTIPVTTPQGLYYVGIFADADNRANQSDISNDRGVSASPVTVTGNGATLPVILTHPQNRNATQGDTISFNVTVSGTGPFSYQWKREGRPIYGETSPQLILRNVSTLQAGNYAVAVANAAGTVTSLSALLTVSPLTLPITQPIPGQCTIYGTIDPNLPTVVITHGWQPGETPALPSWVIDMGQAVTDRCVLAGLPANSSGQRVNIVRYFWQEAFTSYLGLPSAMSYTRGHGSALAKQLKSILGESYDKKLQLVGHSLGSLINAYAVTDLRDWNIEQFTILDAPLSAPGVDPWLFHRFLPSGRVKWVDNYYGTWTAPPAGAGGPISAAAPSGGLALNENHSGVHDFYHTTIANASSSQGFFFSCLLPNFESRPQPQWWTPPPAPLYQGLLGTLTDGPELGWYVLENIGGWVGTGLYSIENQFQNAITLIKPATSSPLTIKSGGPTPSGAGGPEPADGGVTEVSAAIDLVIPSNAQYLTFKFLCTNAGPGDWLTAKFNDNLLMSFRADNFTGTNFQTGMMHVGNYTGQAGQLVVKLNSGGTAASEFVIGNFSFLTTSAPVFSNPRVLNGGFQFDLRGSVGSNYVVQVSTNLINWSSMNTSTIPTEGSISVTNPISGKSKQFYRAVTP